MLRLNKKNIFSLVMCLTALASLPSNATTTIIVSGSRIPSNLENSASSSTIISEEEIENKQARSVTNLLENTSSVQANTSGGLGQSTSLLLRGANAEHTLFLVDGIEMNEPINPTRSFDLSTFSTENIEKIEIIRGPQSLLYGSSAAGGVINIITKKGKGPSKSFLASEYGSYNTFSKSIGTQAGTSQYHYSVAAQQIHSNSFSAANKIYGNKEADSFASTSASLKMGSQLNEANEIQLIAKYSNNFTENDLAGGPGGDSPQAHSRAKEFFSRAEWKSEISAEEWNSNLGFNYSNHQRKNLITQSNSYESSSYKTNWLNTVQINDAHTLLIGTENQREEGSSTDMPIKKGNSTLALFSQWQVSQNQFSASAGARIDSHSQFGKFISFRLAPNYFFTSTNTRMGATIGNGFRAPSLYQLYSQYGTQTLKVEKNLGWDISGEQAISDYVQTKLTYFKNRFSQLIDFDSSNHYSNISMAVTKGVESETQWQATNFSKISLIYNTLQTHNYSTHKKLLRRAENSWKIITDFTWNKFSLQLSEIYTGKRDDIDEQSTRVEMPSYSLLHAQINFKWNDAWKFYAKAENILDKQYEAVRGFGTAGRSFYLGARAEF